MWAFGIIWRPSFVVCHVLTFKKLANQKQELPVVAMFGNGS
jgi:hypothetical protein